MGTIAQLEDDMIRERTRSDRGRETGQQAHRTPALRLRPPRRYLTPNEDYDTAVAILKRIEKGESKRSTARFAGVSRSTIGQILDRADLYREFDPSESVAISESLADD